MLVDKPDVMSEIPADSSERSFALKIEMGCCVVLRLANEHRQEFIAYFEVMLSSSLLFCCYETVLDLAVVFSFKPLKNRGRLQ